MDGFPPPTDVRQRFLEEAAPAASSTPHHDAARCRDEPAQGGTAIDIVTAIVGEIALAAASGPIIWPDIAEAVASYYGKTPRAVVQELEAGP